MSDPHLLGDGLLPTPFTAEEIRRGCPEGRTIRLLVEPATGAPYERVNRFSDCDEEGATIEGWRVLPDGERDDVSSGRSSWLDLQRHAAFPADSTQVTQSTVDLAFGSFAAVVYTTGSGARFVFATDLPGMPARYEIPVGDGVVEVTTMIADERPTS
jgi:hypothetical protein